MGARGPTADSGDGARAARGKGVSRPYWLMRCTGGQFDLGSAEPRQLGSLGWIPSRRLKDAQQTSGADE